MIPISRGGAAGQRERNGISRDNEHEERREPYEEKLAEEKMGGGMAEEMWKTDRKFLHCFAGKSHLKVKGASFEKEVSAGCLARAKGLEMQNSQYFRRNDGSLWEGRALPLSSCLTPLSFPYHFCREFTQDYGKRTKTSGFNWVVSRALVFPERPSIPSSPPCVRIIVWNSTYSALSRFLPV